MATTRRRELTMLEIQEGVEMIPCGCAVSLSSGGIITPCDAIREHYREANQSAIEQLRSFWGGERTGPIARMDELKSHVAAGRALKTKQERKQAAAQKRLVERGE